MNMENIKSKLVDERCYPDVPMTDNDKLYLASIDASNSSAWMDIDVTKAESRECFKRLRALTIRMYHIDEANSGEL